MLCAGCWGSYACCRAADSSQGYELAVHEEVLIPLAAAVRAPPPLAPRSKGEVRQTVLHACPQNSNLQLACSRPTSPDIMLHPQRQALASGKGIRAPASCQLYSHLCTAAALPCATAV